MDYLNQEFIPINPVGFVKKWKESNSNDHISLGLNPSFVRGHQITLGTGGLEFEKKRVRATILDGQFGFDEAPEIPGEYDRVLRFPIHFEFWGRDGSGIQFRHFG